MSKPLGCGLKEEENYPIFLMKWPKLTVAKVAVT